MRLDYLVADFEQEVTRLRALYGAVPWPSRVGFWDGPDGARQGYVVMRLLDAWSRFCRQLVLVSARGKVVTASGLRVSRSPVVGPGQLALDALRAVTPGAGGQRLWEPRWHMPRNAVKAAGLLQIANLSAVSAGLGLSQTIQGISVGSPEDLRNCRNYLAHRSRLANDDLMDLRRRLQVAPDTPADQLSGTRVQGGATLFETWCADLSIRARTSIL